MEFTYGSYCDLLEKLNIHGYEIATYKNWKEKKKCVILRHDIDNDLEKAVHLAEIEKLCEVKATYFILISSDFYNIFSRENLKKIYQIMEYGHEIGLHFDEMCYPELGGRIEKIRERIVWEAELLQKAIGVPVTTVSMHRPSKELLDANLQIPGIVNSYGKTFFHDFKYLSDSRRHWREPVEEIIEQETFDKLHILTHAFWYSEQEISLKDTILSFINSANKQRYNTLQLNIRELKAIMPWEEVR